MIYTIGGIKGGSGKTTIATNLAVYLARKGKEVLLGDADDQ
jgi:chromosome partitioning protein